MAEEACLIFLAARPATAAGGWYRGEKIIPPAPQETAVFGGETCSLSSLLPGCPSRGLSSSLVPAKYSS